MTKLRWTDYDIKNPNKATSEWLEAHKGADEIVYDSMGNPIKAIYKSPISMAHQIMKEAITNTLTQ